MTKRILILVLAFALVAALIFTGCAPARRPYVSPNNNTGTNVGYQGNRTNTGVNDWTNNNPTNTRMGNYRNTDATTVRADGIATAVEQIQGVENATVVITGNTAYVGIDLADTSRTGNERDIKREVAQVVRTTDKDINTVYVSTEVDFMDRLRNVGEGIRNGRPVDAFTTELNEMVRRITPNRW